MYCARVVGRDHDGCLVLTRSSHTVYASGISEVVGTSYHAYQRFRKRAVCRNRSLEAFREAVGRAELVESDELDGRVLVDHRTRSAFVEEDGQIVTTYHASKV